MKGHPQLTTLFNLFNAENQPFRKVHRMIDLFESIIKTYTVVIISEYVKKNKLSDTAKEMLAYGLRTPSLGTWQLFSRVLFEELNKEKHHWMLTDFVEAFESLDKALEKEKTNAISLRNRYAHGATPSDEKCNLDIKKFEPFLIQLLLTKWLENTGIEEIDGMVFLVSENNSLCLHPILLYRKEESPASFAFFNDLKDDKVGLLNYPLAKHYREKKFYSEFHEYLPLQNWKSKGNNEFYQRIEELTDTFKGRNIEREKLLQFVIQKKKGYLSVQGNPGVGKSALLAQFLKDLRSNEEAKKIKVISYFIRRGTPQAQVNHFLNYLIKCTDGVFPAGREIVALDDSYWSLLNKLFEKWRLWGDHNKGDKLLFLVDGLDEAVDDQIVNFMPRENFENILIIYGSRPGGHHYIDEFWGTLPADHHTKLELKGLTREDIRAMLYEVANKYEIERESPWINNILDRSQGNPLYLKLLCSAIENGSITLNDAHAIPNEIDDYYKAILQRYANDKDGDAIFASLFTFAASKDYLTIPHIGLINKLSDATLERVGSTLKEVLNENPLTKDVLDYQLFHESFREYLVKQNGVKVMEAADRLINFCADWQTLEGTYEQRYAFEYYAVHLSESKKEVHHSELLALLKNEPYQVEQKRVLKQFDATKQLYQLSLIKAGELNKHDIQLEAALGLLDLKYEVANEAPQIVMLIANGEIDLGLKRIESFAGNDKEGFKRKFILYMLCLMELTLLESKEKSYRITSIEKLLNHLDEHLPVDHSLVNWEDFFPESLILLIADQLKIRNLDYSILFNKTKPMDYAYWLDSMESFSDSQLDLLYDLAKSNRINEEKVAFVLAKFGRFKQATELALNTTYPNQPIDKIALYYSDKDAEIANLFLQILPDRKNLPAVLNMINYYETNNKFAEASELEEKISYHSDETAGNFALLAVFYFNKNNMEKWNFYFNKAYENLNSEQSDFFKHVKIDEIIDSFVKIKKVDILFNLINSIQIEFWRNISLENLLSNLVNNDNIEQAIKILNEIEDTDFKFISIIIFNLVEKNRLDEALKFLKDMDISNNEYILTGITEILAQNGLIKEANNILNNLSTKNDDFNSLPLALAIGYIKNNNFDKAFECINNKVIWDYKLNEFLKNGLNIISKNSFNNFPEFISKFLRYSAFNSNYEKMKIAKEFINNQKSSRLANNDLNKDNNFILLEDSKEFSNLSSESQFDVLEKIERNGINQNQIESIFDFVLIYLINIDKYSHPSKDIVFKICSKFIEFGKESLVLHVINNYLDNPRDRYGKIEALLKFSNLLLIDNILKSNEYLNKAIEIVKRYDESDIHETIFKDITLLLFKHNRIEEGLNISKKIEKGYWKNSLWLEVGNLFINRYNFENCFEFSKKIPNEVVYFYKKGIVDGLRIEKTTPEALEKLLPFLIEDIENIDMLLFKHGLLLKSEGVDNEIYRFLLGKLNISFFIENDSTPVRKTFTTFNTWIDTIQNPEKELIIRNFFNDVQNGLIEERIFNDLVNSKAFN